MQYLIGIIAITEFLNSKKIVYRKAKHSIDKYNL